MSQAGLDHDSRRELERHALRNVSWLARKLGYQDALDRRQERALVIALGAILVVVIAALVLSAMRKGGADRDALELQRCLVAARVQVMDDVRAKVVREHPELGPAQRQQAIEDAISRATAAMCAKGAPAR